MKQKVTIKDVALAAGVSNGTVHNALNGKAGVSEVVRNNVQRIADELGYQPNVIASALRRKRLRIVAAFPDTVGENKYFYSASWEGYRAYTEELRSYNIETIELPYRDQPGKHFHNRMKELLEKYDWEIDGIITGGRFFGQDQEMLRVLGRRGIALVLISEEMENIDCLCSIRSNHFIDGMLAAEIITPQLREHESVLICAGDMLLPSNKENTKGFEYYFQTNQVSNELFEVYGVDQIYDQLLHYLKSDPAITGLYSVNARCSLLLAKAVEETGRQNQVHLVATDLFPENAEYMKKGIISNIIHKGTTEHAKLGMKVLIDYLIKNELPENKCIKGKSIVLYRSNLNEYYSG